MTTGQPPLLMHVFPTFAVGGAQARFAALANHFGSRWRHAIVALDGNTECRTRLAPDVAATFPAVVTIKADPLGNVRRIRELLRAERPDVLVTSNWGSIEWAFANLLPLVRHIHTEDGFGPEERSAQLRRRCWARRAALRRSTVVLPSRTLLGIAAMQWKLNPVRLRYIPNGVDLVRFAPVPSREAKPVPTIGIVAALRPEKNVARLLRAFQLAGGAGRLVVVGDGAERAALEGLAARLGLGERVQFIGHAKDPRHIYHSFDIFALSSDTEQMPLSILEAMATGLPVVATDVGDVRTMLAAENDRFVVAQDDAALAAGLSALLANPALRGQVGQANRRKAEADYDQETMFAAYGGLLAGTANERSKQANLSVRQYL